MENCTTTIQPFQSPWAQIAEGLRLIGAGMGAAVVQAHEALMQRMDDAASKRHLQALDDRLLSDIGVSRCDIDRRIKGK